MKLLFFILLISSAFARDLNVMKKGNEFAPQVLFIHGSPGTSLTFFNLFESTKLSEKFYLLAPDRPGYGGSGKGKSELSIEVQAREMAKLIENETIVVGYSYGGAVALKLALLFPEKVKAIILLAPAINPKTEKLKWWQSPAYLEAIRNMLPSDLRVSMEESIALVDQLKTLELETIHVPVMYVQGLNDNVVSTKTADYVKDRFTGTQVNIQMIENLDHHVPEKVPALVAKIIEGLY